MLPTRRRARTCPRCRFPLERTPHATAACPQCRARLRRRRRRSFRETLWNGKWYLRVVGLLALASMATTLFAPATPVPPVFSIAALGGVGVACILAADFVGDDWP